MACKTSGTLYMITFEITNYNGVTNAWLVKSLGPDVRYHLLDPDTNYTSLDHDINQWVLLQGLYAGSCLWCDDWLLHHLGPNRCGNVILDMDCRNLLLFLGLVTILGVVHIIISAYLLRMNKCILLRAHHNSRCMNM